MYLDKNTGLIVPGAAPGGGGGTDAPVVTQPAPAVSLNSSTGVVTASYIPVAGLVQDTAKKSGTLQLTAQGAQTITPGTSNKTIAAGRYLTGVQTIKGDSNLAAGNIKKGVSVFNITGTYAGSVEPVIPSACIAYIGGNGQLYVKQSSGITVGGLTKQSTSDREGWDAYSGFSSGAFAGSVLSQDGVYLDWGGFSDFTKKWTLHTLISGYPASDAYWNTGYHLRFAWGFNTQEYGYEGNYNISDLPVYVYGERPARYNTAVAIQDGAGGGGEICASGLYPIGFTWDGTNAKAYWLSMFPLGGSAIKTTMYPYDEEMGMPGDKMIVGYRLYIGKPPAFTDNWNGNITTNSGMVVGGFALELNPVGYTSAADYISPLLDGTYKNL